MEFTLSWRCALTLDILRRLYTTCFTHSCTLSMAWSSDFYFIFCEDCVVSRRCALLCGGDLSELLLHAAIIGDEEHYIWIGIILPFSFTHSSLGPFLYIVLCKEKKRPFSFVRSWALGLVFPYSSSFLPICHTPSFYSLK